jgi:3',5'-cyclic AMP phosphodiesterase CpdA/Zn-dependent peptidase ImmA (M78 family)
MTPNVLLVSRKRDKQVNSVDRRSHSRRDSGEQGILDLFPQRPSVDSLGGRLVAWREGVGLTSESLGWLCDIHPFKVEQLERGLRTRGTATTLKAIAAAFKVTVPNFATGKAVLAVPTALETRTMRRVSARSGHVVVEDAPPIMRFAWTLFEGRPCASRLLPPEPPIDHRLLPDVESTEMLVESLLEGLDDRNGLVTDLYGLCEKLKGITVHFDDLKSDGYFVEMWPGADFIILDPDKPQVRTRFTLAHELGHFILCRRLGMGFASGPDIEAWCNAFAATLLIPARYLGTGALTREDALFFLLERGTREFLVSSQTLRQRIADFHDVSIFTVGIEGKGLTVESQQLPRKWTTAERQRIVLALTSLNASDLLDNEGSSYYCPESRLLFAFRRKAGRPFHFDVIPLGRVRTDEPKRTDSSSDDSCASTSLGEESGSVDVGLRESQDCDSLGRGTGSTQTFGPGEIVATKPVTGLPIIVHLSDLHFAGTTGIAGDSTKHRFYEGVDEKPLDQHLVEDWGPEALELASESKRLHLVVSGDITYSATPAEFDQALRALESITHAISLPRDRVHIIPGNHDVNWGLGKSDPTQRFDNYLAFLNRFYGPDLVSERFPLIKWPVALGDTRPKPSKILYFAAFPDEKLLFAGLNSCVYESEERHFGFVGELQLQELRKRLAAAQVDADWVRVLMMHHHLSPHPEGVKSRGDDEPWPDLSIARDAGLIETCLMDLGFDFVLHGHKHKPFLREISFPGARSASDRHSLFVCGSGSVSCTELEHSYANHYQILQMRSVPRKSGAELCKLTYRELAVKPGAVWTTSREVRLQG